MLGIVLTPNGYVPGAAPWEINKITGGRWGQYLKPFDPQYNTSGEAGYYYDTPLGAIPTDAELGPARCATPVHSGWINSKQGYLAPPWVPPNGWNPAGPYGPPTSLGQAIHEEISRHDQRMFLLGVVSTAAVVTVALVHVAKYRKGCK